MPYVVQMRRSVFLHLKPNVRRTLHLAQRINFISRIKSVCGEGLLSVYTQAEQAQVSRNFYGQGSASASHSAMNSSRPRQVSTFMRAFFTQELKLMNLWLYFSFDHQLRKLMLWMSVSFQGLDAFIVDRLQLCCWWQLLRSNSRSSHCFNEKLAILVVRFFECCSQLISLAWENLRWNLLLCQFDVCTFGAFLVNPIVFRNLVR